ncbi:MAG TPA: S41 family peptidase [Chitinophagaceae bacterium]|nr:S41 family peptidase [Chitinophagaceae bacterium]
MKPITLLIACACIFFTATAQSNDAYFLSQPCLTPDGQTVIFSFEGDLWKASVKDGIATRLTGMQGYETSAKISPDGKWVAFTGRQFGNADVFIMPLEGGDVKQLTWFSGTDDVSSWSWDSKYIYFTSNRDSRQSTYKVSINGGTAERVFGDNFFLYDHNVFEDPTTGELFFNDTWESSNQVARKRYKGPFNPDIQSYNPTTKKYKRYTDWQGKDFGATLDKKGNIYFISDEANGEYNLYTFDNGKKTQLTKFTTSIKSPIVNANGGEVVFEKDYQLWLYNVASKSAEKMHISIVRNNILPQEKDFEVRQNITAFDVSPDNKKLAFISRGELFVSDIEGKYIEQIHRGSAERVSEVKWMSDNKTLLFNQTLDGFQNLYTVAADGSSPIKQLTTDAANDRDITINKKRNTAVYLSGRNEVRLLDLKTWQSKTIVKDEIWGFEGSGPGFSPNDEYVIFTAFRNFEQDIFIHNIKEDKTINLTSTGITETSPIWSPDSKYIYFISSRLQAAYPTGLQDPHIYRLPLQKIDEPYRTDKFDELFKEAKKDTSSKKDSAIVPIKIDLDRIMDRIEQVGPSFGSQYLSEVLQRDTKTFVLYISDRTDGEPALFKTTLEPFEMPKTEKINGTEGGAGSIVVSSEKYYILVHGNIAKLNIDANKVDPISISYTFRRNLSAEFSQVFHEAWAQLDENYYDEKFHGIDWKKTEQYYSQFLPYLNNRNDLRVLLNDMLGELNSSHQGFSSFGADETISLHNTTMQTGIIFDNTNPYKVDHVLFNSAADKDDIKVQPGDMLTTVDDKSIDPAQDRFYYFTRPSLDKEIKLGFKRGKDTITVKIHPQFSIVDGLYDEWIDNNQKRVDERGNKRIAYSCMKDMGEGQLEHFIEDMTKELINRDALILDLRYNTGGNVHDKVLEFLSQRSYLQWKYREGKLTKQPNFAPSDKPIILLTNEQSLSDAEMTATGFKALKLGKIVGNETYHWIIFTSGAGLVDGSFVRLPSWGCYTLDGKDIEFNGVQPDIKVVNTFEDRINNRDPQLDAAIDEILKELNTQKTK